MSRERLEYKITGDSSSFRNSIKQSEKSVNGFQQQLKGVASTMKLVFVGALTAAGYQAVRSARSFDKSMTKIKSLVGIAGDEVDRMGGTAKKMAKETGVSANDAADALFFITSAGLEGSEAMDVLEASMKAAAVGLGETKTVADLATSALNAYGSENLSAIEATDVLTASVREGKLEANELAGSMGRVIPIASAMGLSFNEVGAAFAAMSRTGTNAAEASTQLRSILVALNKPSVEARKQLKDLDLSTEGLRKQIREKGLLSTLETLKEKFEGNVDAQNKVFGGTRAMMGVMDLLGTNIEGTKEIFEELNKALGATDTAFEIASNSVEFKLTKALNELSVVGTELGSKILPPLVFMLQRINNIFSNQIMEKYNQGILDIGESSKEYLEKLKEQKRREKEISDGMQGITARRVKAQQDLLKADQKIKEEEERRQLRLKTLKEITDKYNESIIKLKNEHKILGDEVDINAEKMNLLKNSMIDLLNKGFKESHPLFQRFATDLKLVEKNIHDINAARGVLQAEDLAKDTPLSIIDFTELEKELENVKTFRDNLNAINEQANADLSQSVDSMFEEQNQKRLQQFQSFQQQVQQVAGMMQQHLVGLSDQFIASLGLANEGIQGMVQSMLKVLMQLAIQSIINAAVQKALSKAQVATQFSTAQAGAISSATNTAALIPGGFFALPGMIAAATSMVSGAFAGLTAFADGGIVTKPMMGLVGEAGSEAIIPLNKLPQLMQASQGKQNGQFTLRGQDLILALERAGDFRARITG